MEAVIKRTFTKYEEVQMMFIIILLDVCYLSNTNNAHMYIVDKSQANAAIRPLDVVYQARMLQ